MSDQNDHTRLPHICSPEDLYLLRIEVLQGVTVKKVIELARINVNLGFGTNSYACGRVQKSCLTMFRVLTPPTL